MSDQIYIDITKDELLNKVSEMKKDGYLLSQVCATKKEGFDILYSFEKDYELTNLRLSLNEADEIESVSGIYSHVYLYENEMKDLFGIKINNINIDFKGYLYKTSVKTPFNAGEQAE